MDAVTLKTQAALPRPERVAVSRVAVADAGKSLPESGKPTPSKSLPPPVAAPEVTIEQAVAQIQAYVAESQRDLQFDIDDATGRTVVSVYSASGELIRQFPSEEVLKIAAALQEQGLSLINQQA